MRPGVVAVLLLGLLACGPAAGAPGNPPAAAPAGATTAAVTSASTADGGDQSWRAEWDRTVAAAKREGRLVVAAAPSDAWRRALTAFEAEYPEIKIEYTGINSRDLYPRILREREAGLYLWDLRVGGVASDTYEFKQAGGLDPIRPALQLPEVTADGVWFGGLERLFLDQEGAYLPSFLAYESPVAFVNRDFVAPSELQAIEHLLDPRWRGKIVIQDPRGGAGSGALFAFLTIYGEEFVRDLLSKQEVVVTGDQRQQVEWVARGRYPIGIGFVEAELQPFQQEGIGLNVKAIPARSGILTAGFGTVQLVNRRPHPNAATVFANWLLTRDVQTHLTQAVSGVNSRRLDVPAGTPEIAANPNRQYIERNREEYLPYWDKTAQLARELAR
jgi:ABC-type Fe3+ transport system substrate-binding protein